MLVNKNNIYDIREGKLIITWYLPMKL
jgi:hypothetical protein